MAVKLTRERLGRDGENTISKLGDVLQSALTNKFAEYAIASDWEIHGRGLFRGIRCAGRSDSSQRAGEILKRACEIARDDYSMYIYPAHESFLVMPAYDITEDDVRDIADRTARALRDAIKEFREQNLVERTCPRVSFP